MITGREAVVSIEQAIQGLRGDETQLETALASASETAARARQTETEGLRALARLKLDGLSQSKLVGELDTTEQRALDLIAAERAHLEALDKRRAAALSTLAQAEDRKRAAGGALNAAIAAVEAKQREVAQMVIGTPDWLAAKRAVDEARKIAAAAEEKSARAIADLTEKRKPYEADALFMYLWRRKHDTAEDLSGFFVRFFDRRVARLIDYRQARANYATLLAIPSRLTDHAKTRQEAIEDAKKAQGEIERKALLAAGVETLEERLARAQADDNAALSQVVGATTALQRIEKEKGDVQVSDGAGRAAALDLLAQQLERADMRKLYADAFKTPTPDDENALNAISRARQQLASAEQSAASLRDQLQDLVRRRGELENARDHARAQGYDSPWGNFANHVLIYDILRGIVAGALSASDLGRAMAGEYRRRDPGFDVNWGGGFGSGDSSSPWGPAPSASPTTGNGWKTTDSF